MWAKLVVTDKHTNRQTTVSYPSCAWAPRVNNWSKQWQPPGREIFTTTVSSQTRSCVSYCTTPVTVRGVYYSQNFRVSNHGLQSAGELDRKRVRCTIPNVWHVGMPLMHSELRAASEVQQCWNNRSTDVLRHCTLQRQNEAKCQDVFNWVLACTQSKQF